METPCSGQYTTIEPVIGRDNIPAFSKAARFHRICVIMMNVLFADVRHRNNDPMRRKSLQHMSFQELLYAHDTLIVAKNTQNARELIRYIEEESAYYNMRLNREKCVCITFNKNNQVTFADGENPSKM